MKTAIVHDWLNGMRGGEKTLEAMLELYPESTIYTLFHERGKVSPKIESRPIVTSWLNSIPGIYRWYRNLLPLFPAAINSLEVRGYDLVISSSHAVAKAVRTNGAIHVCYCHTPMRYLWDSEADYGMSRWRRQAFGLLRHRLRRWDIVTSRRVDYFLANSQFVRDRIQRYYGREATVIHPPVDIRFFTPSSELEREDFFLAAGALTPYKRVDVIVQAFNQLGKRLVVAGTGPELSRLRRMAGGSVEFLGWIGDSELRNLYRRARALVFAAREDFGIIPVEAMACGCPVAAFSVGGAAETIREGVSGVFFNEQSAQAVIESLSRLEMKTWPAEQVRSPAEKFSRENFKTHLRTFIDSKLFEGAVKVAP